MGLPSQNYWKKIMTFLDSLRLGPGTHGISPILIPRLEDISCISARVPNHHPIRYLWKGYSATFFHKYFMLYGRVKRLIYLIIYTHYLYTFINSVLRERRTNLALFSALFFAFVHLK